jgi:hypothetical protein
MRDRKWTDDEEINAILNAKTAQTDEVHKYSRIMQHRTIEAMNGLYIGLQGVMQTIHRAADRLSDNLAEATRTIHTAADRVSDNLAEATETLHRAADQLSGNLTEATKKVDDFTRGVKEAGEAQAAQQRKIVFLTWVIAIATVVYAIITGASVYEMAQANAIQLQMAAATNRAADVATAGNLIQHDMVAVTAKAADAAIAGNDIQRQALQQAHSVAVKPRKKPSGSKK